MVYMGRDVARITAIGRLIIILYYTPGGGVDCRRHGGWWWLVAIVEEIEKQCSVENGRPHFRRLQTNTPDFDWSYSKAAGLYSALYTERSLAAVGQFNYIYYMHYYITHSKTTVNGHLYNVDTLFTVDALLKVNAQAILSPNYMDTCNYNIDPRNRK